jgi:hypothetical protein
VGETCTTVGSTPAAPTKIASQEERKTPTRVGVGVV